MVQQHRLNSKLLAEVLRRNEEVLTGYYIFNIAISHKHISHLLHQRMK